MGAILGSDRLLVLDWTIESLLLPVTDMSQTKTELSSLAYLSIATDLDTFYTHICNHSTITTLFHTYLILLQIKSSTYIIYRALDLPNLGPKFGPIPNAK